MSDPLVGRVLNNAYRIDRQLADGGMSLVYLGEQLSLGRSVVLKVLRPGFNDEDFIQLFLREARVNSQLNHPNVVGVFDFGRDEDIVFLAMEHLDGATLGDVVAMQQGLSLAHSLWVMEQVCAGVHAAHKLNVIHRDLKPNNIMVCEVSGDTTVAKVLDFGISKPLNEDDLKHTRLGMVMGTPGFLSPEQIAGERNMDARADVYALGAILYFMLTGDKPFKGASIEVIMNKQLKEPPAPLSEDQLKDASALCLQPVLTRAMAVNRDERYPDVKSLWQDILNHAGEFQKVNIQGEAPPQVLATRYMFVFKGELVEGSAVDDVKQALQASLKFKPQQIDRLFSGRRVIVRKNIAHADANRIAELFNKAGAKGSVEEMPAATRIQKREGDPPSLPASLPSMGLIEPIALRDIPKPQPQSTLAAENGSRVSLPQTSKAKNKYYLFALVGVLVVMLPLLLTVAPLRYALSDFWQLTIKGEALPRGVDSQTVTIGMSAAFTGSAREIGQSMRVGVDALFRTVNDEGGIHGRSLKLLHLDDGYEPARALVNLDAFLEDKTGAFALLGNVGTPTAKVLLPKALENNFIIFGTFSGASLLRNDPPDRYVFNFRASYSDETSALIHYFVGQEKIDPRRVAVFFQNDSYGRDGLAGVVRALRDYGVEEQDIMQASYQRNSARVGHAMAVLGERVNDIDVVIVVGTYAASAALVSEMRGAGYAGRFANVSFVGSRALVERLQEKGHDYEGIVVSQVVPLYSSYATGVLRYREAMKRYYPGEPLGFISLEGFISASIFVEALRRSGRYFSSESLVDTLESIDALDLGIGTVVSFSPSNHQASHRVWGSVVNAEGDFELLELMPDKVHE